MGTPAVHLQRRERRRHLLDRPDERRQRRVDLLARRRHGVRRFGDFTVGVVGGAGRAEAEARRVALAHRLHVVGQPRRRADAHDEHAGRERVERAGVADLRLAREPPLHAVHHVARGHARRACR